MKKPILLLLWPALLCAACSLFGGDDADLSDLERHRRQWERQGVDSYAYDLTIGCFCPYYGPVRIMVVRGAVASATRQETDTPVEANAWGFAVLTIDGLFDVVEDAIRRDAHRLEVSYDPTWGFPATIAIDFDENAIDEEIAYTAAHFQPLRNE